MNCSLKVLNKYFKSELDFTIKYRNQFVYILRILSCYLHSYLVITLKLKNYITNT